jgi:hypothetical protein
MCCVDSVLSAFQPGGTGPFEPQFSISKFIAARRYEFFEAWDIDEVARSPKSSLRRQPRGPRVPVILIPLRMSVGRVRLDGRVMDMATFTALILRGEIAKVA